MIFRRIVLFNSLLFIVNCAFSQPWMKDIKVKKGSSVNFYDVQKTAENYFLIHPKGKGSGWKQYKRSEYMLEQRVYPSGKIPFSGTTFENFKKYKDSNIEYFSSKRKAADVWTSLGITSWENGKQGVNPGNGRLNFVMVHPNDPSTIFAGTPAGGLWKTTDKGTTWTPLTDKLPSLGVSGLAIDPSNPDRMFMATGDGDRHGGSGEGPYSYGILKTLDGGSTWLETGLKWEVKMGEVFSKIVMSPDDFNVLIAASTDGLFRTTDGGDNWTQILDGKDFKDIEFKTDDSDVVFASTRHGSNRAELYRSTNNGASWIQITQGIPTTDVERIAIGVTPADPNYVYLIISNSGSRLKGLYRSTDGGLTFNLRYDDKNIFGYPKDASDGSGHAWYDLCIGVSPTDKNELYIGAINVWKSIDGGSSVQISGFWEYPDNSIEYVHADVHDIVYSGSTVLVGCDGGMFLTENGGVKWEDKSQELAISQFYCLGASTTDENLIMVGAQDNGVFQYDNGKWIHTYGDDGMEQIVDPTNANTIYTCTYFGNTFKSIDRAVNNSYTSNQIGEGGTWVTRLVLDPNDPNTLYSGRTNVWKSTNGGGSWSSISNLNGSAVTAITVAPSDSKVIYVAKRGELYKTTNEGSSWSSIDAGLPDLNITYIAVSYDDPQKVWVTVSGYTEDAKVYMTSNGGTSWENYSQNLPNVPANTIVYQQGTSDALYIGMDVGVFYRDANLEAWVPYMDGFPNVVVSELEIHHGAQKLRAATFGRGLWEAPLSVPSEIKPIAAFKADQTSICPGTSIQFTDMSYFEPKTWTWEFEGGTPAVSTDLNPLVTYNSPGSYKVKLTVTGDNGTDIEEKSGYINVLQSSSSLQQDFEGSFPPMGWVINNPDGSYTWGKSADAGFNSSSCMVMDNTSNSTIGAKDEIVLGGNVQFGNVDEVSITFDLAYTKYDNSSEDKLKVYISFDCGETWEKVYDKTHTELETKVVSTGQSNAWIPSSNDDWRNERIIVPINDQKTMMVKFVGESGYGTKVWIDNILIDYQETISNFESENVIVYPNPSSGNVTIDFSRSNKSKWNKIEVRNLVGQLISINPISSTQRMILDLSNHAKGTYFILLRSNEGIGAMKKINIQ